MMLTQEYTDEKPVTEETKDTLLFTALLTCKEGYPFTVWLSKVTRKLYSKNEYKDCYHFEAKGKLKTGTYLDLSKYIDDLESATAELYRFVGEWCVWGYDINSTAKSDYYPFGSMWDPTKRLKHVDLTGRGKIE